MLSCLMCRFISYLLSCLLACIRCGAAPSAFHGQRSPLQGIPQQGTGHRRSDTPCGASVFQHLLLLRQRLQDVGPHGDVAWNGYLFHILGNCRYMFHGVRHSSFGQVHFRWKGIGRQSQQRPPKLHSPTVGETPLSRLLRIYTRGGEKRYRTRHPTPHVETSAAAAPPQLRLALVDALQCVNGVRRIPMSAADTARYSSCRHCALGRWDRSLSNMKRVWQKQPAYVK